MLRLAWQQIPHDMVTDILCLTENFDGIVLDLEHSVFNPETVYTCITKCKANGVRCFVRVSNIDHTIRAYLDSGAYGVILSTVETMKQVNELRNLCLYPPKGKRGQGLVRENGWGKNESLLGKTIPFLIGQIETSTGVENLSEIHESELFDAYLIGPYDLSASIGVVGQFEHESYLKLIEKIESIIPKEKLGYHIVKDVEKQYPTYNDYGVIALSMDTMALCEYVSQMTNIYHNSRSINKRKCK